MKKITLLFFALVAFSWQSNAQVLDEGFESGNIPAGWTQEYEAASEDWALVDANGDGSVTPRTGAYMAEFRTGTSGDATKLVTPALDLTTLTNPQLTFYYANVNWFGDIDELRIYYKSSAAGAWTQIGSDYVDEQTAWTEVRLILPNPSNDYYIAFEATSNWARGMNVDDITVAEGPSCTQLVSNSETIVPDCASSQFSIHVDVATAGDGDVITDGLGGSFPIMAGTVTAGPYDFGVTATLSVEHTDAACDYELGDFSMAACPPVNNLCANAISLTPGAVFADNAIVGQTNLGATGSGEMPLPTCSVYDPVDVSGNGGDMWYTIVVPADGNITIETNGDPYDNGGDSGMAVYSGDCGALVEIDCDDDGSVDGAYSLIEIADPALAGETIYLRVFEYGGNDVMTFQVSAYNATLATQDFDNGVAFTYYPNPVNSSLSLKAQNNIQNVSIYNMLGQEVLRTAPNSVDSMVDMSALQSGAYFVKVSIDGATETVRVIKN